MISDKEPLVSVIIPNYCHAKYLDERIQSVLGQTYQNFEVIILDDCSTDNSMEVINRYRNHPKVAKIVVNEKNSGSPFKQWQKGIAMARGEIIWIAESDDSCELMFLETLVKLYQENGAVLAFCKSKTIDEYGNELENHFQDGLMGPFSMDGKIFVDKYLIDNPYVMNISSAVFCKIMATECQAYADFKGAGDWLFTIEMALRGQIYYLNKPLNFYRFHNNNTTKREITNGHGELEIKNLYDFLLNRNYITLKQYKHQRKRRLKKITFSDLDKEIKKVVLNYWSITYIERTCMRLLIIYNSILVFLKKVNP